MPRTVSGRRATRTAADGGRCGCSNWWIADWMRCWREDTAVTSRRVCGYTDGVAELDRPGLAWRERERERESKGERETWWPCLRSCAPSTRFRAYWNHVTALIPDIHACKTRAADCFTPDVFLLTLCEWQFDFEFPQIAIGYTDKLSGGFRGGGVEPAPPPPFGRRTDVVTHGHVS